MAEAAASDWAERLASGDHTALEELLDAQTRRLGQDLLRRFAYQLQACDVEDILMKAAFLLWERRECLSGVCASPIAWLWQIARAQARDYVKARARRRRLHAEYTDQLTRGLHVVHPSEMRFLANRWQARAAIVALIDAAMLSDRERCIVLADLASRDGVACSQYLGTELGVTPKTIRSYRWRALHKLRLAALDLCTSPGFRKSLAGLSQVRRPQKNGRQ